MKQGEVLSPLLFNLYLNDLPQIFNDDCDPLQFSGRKLNILMYADDMVVLSKSKNGLQACLEKLHQYFSDWKLMVNANKSKVIFNKTGRLYKEQLRYNNEELECVREYRYLGIEFSLNGNFTVAKEVLRKRALKATFKLRKIISAEAMKPRQTVKLFKRCVFPVGLYGVEIWGVPKGPTGKIFKKLEDLPFERVYMMFAKSALGVHRKACNAGVRGELGLLPAWLESTVATLQYCQRLNKLKTGCLLKSVYDLSIDEDNKGVYTWYSGIKELCSKLLGVNTQQMFSMCRPEIYLKLKHIHTEYWQQTMHKGEGLGKLDVYCKIKKNIAFESYLDLHNAKHRHAFTQLRISAHSLEVETGRYSRISRQDRVCQMCNSQEIGDEIHLLTSCLLLKDERQKLFSEIQDYCYNFTTLNNAHKAQYMLTAEGAIQMAVVRFCSEAFSKRATRVNT